MHFDYDSFAAQFSNLDDEELKAELAIAQERAEQEHERWYEQ